MISQKNIDNVLNTIEEANKLFVEIYDITSQINSGVYYYDFKTTVLNGANGNHPTIRATFYIDGEPLFFLIGRQGIDLNIIPTIFYKIFKNYITIRSIWNEHAASLKEQINKLQQNREKINHFKEICKYIGAEVVKYTQGCSISADFLDISYVERKYTLTFKTKLGNFKLEFNHKGESVFPNGFPQCLYIDNIDELKDIWEKEKKKIAERLINIKKDNIEVLNKDLEKYIEVTNMSNN